MKLNKLLRNNTFLINSGVCLIVLLTICYFGLGSSIKTTYAADCLINENGETVCLGETNILHGGYQWKNEISYPGSDMIFDVDFVATNGNSYTGIKFYSLTSPRYTLAYRGTNNKYVTVYTYTSRNDRWQLDGDWGNYANLMIGFQTPQTVSDIAYKWFIENTTPLNACYYNEDSGRFVWTNVDVGIEVKSASDETTCKNSRVLKLIDPTKTVKFDGNDSYYAFFPKGTSVTIYDTVKKFAFSRVGYLHNGEWNTSSSGTGSIYKDSVAFNIDNNLTLYTMWTPETYTVKFAANGGEGEMADQTFKYDEAQQLNENTFVKAGSVFKGWTSSGLGDSKIYNDKESVLNLRGWSITNELTFTAIWVEESKKILVYDANAGSDDVSNMPSPSNFSFNSGEEITISSNVPVRDGYVFVGWYTNADGTGTEYIKESKHNLNDDLKLYAKWVKPSKIDEVYEIDETNKLIYVEAATTGDMFENSIALGEGYKLNVDKKTVDGKEVLYTGGNLKILDSGDKTYAEYTVIVKGEVTGEGELNYRDYVVVFNHIYKTKNTYSDKKLLTGNFEKAADYSMNGTIGYEDYVKIFNKIKSLKGVTK